MPGVIESFVLLGLTSLGVTGGALGIATAALTYAIVGGIGVGINLLAQALMPRPPQPKPEDVQTSLRQPAQPRARHYGRVKVSGPWVFGESIEGFFHRVIAIGQGPIDAIEQFWVDDNQVTLNGSGVVTSPPYNLSYSNTVTIFNRLGAATETSYAPLTAAFPEWTVNHTGDGVASLYVIQAPANQEDFFSVFPNGINTNYRVVLRGAKCLNPLTGTTVWTDNAATVVRDYMMHQDGMRLPTSLFTTPLAAAGWNAAFARANEDVPLAAGGTEDRYRLWGSYYLNERPADVVSRMLAACDGRIYPTSDSGIKLDIGTWAEPTAVLTEDSIVGFSDLSRGKDILTTANVIRATYLGVDQDYQTADADPWIDAVDVAARGEIELDTSFIMSPSHSQARRLMKLTAFRANPTWVGTFQCNLRGLAALGERFVRINYPQLSINEVFEVQDFRFLIGEGNILQGVTLQVQSMPQAAYNWTPAQEEGDAPVRGTTTVTRTIPVPSTLSVTVRRKVIAGLSVPYGVLSFPAPPVSLKVEAQGKRTADSQWLAIPVQAGATEAESFALTDGEQYEFQIRHSSLTGRKSAWTSSATVAPEDDAVAPGPITGLSATGGAGQVAMSWTNPASANFNAVNIRRNTANNEATATLVRVEYGSPSAGDAWTNTGLAAGTYYFWLKARNASGIESASVASGAKIVT